MTHLGYLVSVLHEAASEAWAQLGAKAGRDLSAARDGERDPELWVDGGGGERRTAAAAASRGGKWQQPRRDGR